MSPAAQDYPVALTTAQARLRMAPPDVALAAVLAQAALDAVPPGATVRALVVVDRVAVGIGDRRPHTTPQYRQRLALEGVALAVHRGLAVLVRTPAGTPELARADGSVQDRPAATARLRRPPR